ncbi:hypothetical protein JCM8547_004057 [Rhodosporidiobolus lusitaniae]
MSSTSTSTSSEALREQGNAAFRSSRWEEAARLYSEALEAVPSTSAAPSTEEEKHLAALYSNWAAARIQLYQLDLALLDTAATYALERDWSRARAREAEAFSRMSTFEEARASYATATSLAEDDSTRSRYMSASALCLRDLQQQRKLDSLFSEAEASLAFAERYGEYVKGCGKPDEEGMVSAETAVYAWEGCEKALREMDEQLDVKESGEVEAATPSPVLDLAGAILTDTRGLHLPPGKSHELPLSEKLRLQLAWDAKVFEVEQSLKPNVVPREVIEAFDERVKKEGWAKVKPALAHFIRGSFVAAFIDEVQLRTEKAASQYRFVIGLLQEGQALWADVAEEEKGSTFRFTFERKVKQRLLETLAHGHFRTGDDEKYPLLEAQNLAEILMDECAREKAISDPVSTYAFQVQPIVAAGKAFAYSLRHRAILRENMLDFAAGYWLHPGMMKAAGKLYSTAGKLLPNDDPEKAVNLFNALAFDLRGGGLTVIALFERAAEAEAALVPPEKIFASSRFSSLSSLRFPDPFALIAVGPSSRQFDSRQLVRQVCTAARTHLSLHLPHIPSSAFETTLKPVPTVFRDKVPQGQSWETLVDEEVRQARSTSLDHLLPFPSFFFHPVSPSARCTMSAATLRQRKPDSRPDDVLASSDSEDEKETAVQGKEGSFEPWEVPNFTIKEILGAIPAHCFERSALRAGVNVVIDFTLITILGYCATYIDPNFNFQNGAILSGWPGFAAKWTLWNLYWLVAGWVFTGVWIMGHECGHQAFSPSKRINNTMGLFLHSFVLVPYHSWRISHAKHHAATGHATRDEVFVPRTKSFRDAKPTGKKIKVAGDMELDELLEDAPLYRLGWLLIQQLFGWPAYLIANASGQPWYPKFTNHFDPASLVFDKRHREQVLLSDAFLVGMLTLLTVFGHFMGGFSAVVKYYGIPYLYTNHWLVMITYLQHTDISLPHYSGRVWNFQRGALCTMDRNLLGPVGPYLMHGICETHVAHHISSKIPHYHAWEATEALKKFLGKHYHSTNESMFVSLWKNYKLCRYVDDEGDVLFYRDAYGRQYRKIAPEDIPSDSGVDM